MKRSRRGASTRSPRRGVWPRVPARVMWTGAVALGLTLLVGGTWYAGHSLAQVPVARVLFSGELQHVDREQLVTQVRPLLRRTGFFTVDLQALRGSVEALAWVDEAAVLRHWPNELEVVVSEQQPIARWGENGLINHRGKVFRPRNLPGDLALPALDGPQGTATEVVRQYGDLAALLAQERLELDALSVDERGSWTATLADGVRLNLGAEQLPLRARRFMRAYRAELAQRFEQVAYVDLRYANGLAVGWKAAPEQRS